MQNAAETATQGLNALSKFASTVGEIYYVFGGKAREIRQIAKAEGDAMIITAEAEAKAAMIRAKGEDAVAEFVLARETLKMQNTLNVIDKAEALISPTDVASEEPVNQDWLNRFQTIVEDVSDDEMQNLWAQILAGEIKRPQSCSLRTLDILRNLSTEEAVLFTKHCSNIMNGMLVTQFDKANVTEYGVLSEAGLIVLNPLERTYTVQKNDLSLPILVDVDNDIFIKMKNTENEKTFKISHYALSKAGKELSQLVRSDKSLLIDQLGKYLKEKTNCVVTLHEIVNRIEGQECQILNRPYKTF